MGHSTLIYGDIDTGKTLITAEFIKFLLMEKEIAPQNITILDFAPELHYLNDKKIGGKIVDFYENSINCNYLALKGKIEPPRLNAKSKKDLLNIANYNYQLTLEIIQKFNKIPTEILIINDLSIFLHKGDIKTILKAKNNAATFLANSYYGLSIKNPYSKQFDDYERNVIESILKNVDFSYLTT